MKTTRATAILALALLIPLSPALAQGGPGSGTRGNAGCGVNAAITALPMQALDADERTALVFMREEEKLARDVYRAMDDRWGLRVFRNIAGAEQTHMNLMLSLLEKYGIADPAAGLEAGEFADPSFQQLYEELVTQGNESLNQALVVGATIEDLDIRDLAVELAQTDNEDISMAFQNLQKGSRNHLRAFISLVEANGVSYEPQFISIDELDAILDSPTERGVVGADGELVAGTSCGSSGARRWKRNARFR